MRFRAGIQNWIIKGSPHRRQWGIKSKTSLKRMGTGSVLRFAKGIMQDLARALFNYSIYSLEQPKPFLRCISSIRDN